jgi:thiol-disulfide isomerase/thioredoxin
VSDDANAPAFDLPGTNGRISLEQYRGQVVYLDFWASWCTPCRQSFPWMNAMQAKYGPQGLRVVAINLDAIDQDAQRFLADVPARFVIGFDPTFTTPHRYGVKGMPTSIVINADGRILARHMGFRPADQQALEQTIRTALGVAK